MKTNTKIIVASAFTVGVLSRLCNVAVKRVKKTREEESVKTPLFSQKIHSIL